MAFESSVEQQILLGRKTRDPNLWIWFLPVLGVSAGHLLTLEYSPLIRMLAITGLLFLGMKAVVLSCADRGQALAARSFWWFMFWPGMRPALFYSRQGKCAGEGTALLRQGSMRCAFGLGLLAMTHLELPLVFRMFLVMAGWSLVLHFGLFAFLTVHYQRWGWRVRQPFFEPWKAGSLGDFWSQRWNRVFSEMLSQSVYRPVVSRFGHSAGILSVFTVSGLLHEAAITLPIQTGYGGPLCYFLLQGILVLLERTKRRHFAGFSGVKLLVSILLPLPLLFPVAFVRDVLLPLAGAGL